MYHAVLWMLTIERCVCTLVHREKQNDNKLNELKERGKMMKSIKKLMGMLLLGSVAVLGVGCGTETNAPTNQQEEANKEMVTITHKLGEVQVPKNPQSVVVTDFGILDTLDALEVEGITGIPQDTTAVPNYLQDYMTKDYTNIGGLKEINYEQLYELQPDVIFIGGRLEDQYEELSKVAPVVYLAPDQEDYMGSLEKNVTCIAEIFGKEDVAKDKLAQIKEDTQAVKERAESGEVTGLVTMINKGEVSAFGEVSRFGMIHNAFGIKAADPHLTNSTHGQVVTFEYLREVNPNYLFVVDKNVLSEDGGSQTAKDTLNNPLVNQMDAAQNNHIVFLDTNAWYIATGGLKATEVMVKNISEGIQ